MYQACIFDLDGTLANTLGSIAYYSNRALRECGYREIPAQRYRKLVGNGAAVQVRRMMDLSAGEGGWTEEDYRRVSALYGALYASDPCYLLEAYAGMAETVAGLRAAGVGLGVVSNKPDAWVKAIVARLFPAGGFGVCRGQRDGFPLKPAPDGALAAARKLGAESARCLFAGDSETDMKTGSAAGMDTIGVLWGFRTREELVNSGAVYLARRPEQILRIAAGDGTDCRAARQR